MLVRFALLALCGSVSLVSCLAPGTRKTSQRPSCSKGLSLVVIRGIQTEKGLKQREANRLRKKHQKQCSFSRQHPLHFPNAPTIQIYRGCQQEFIVFHRGSGGQPGTLKHSLPARWNVRFRKYVQLFSKGLSIGLMTGCNPYTTPQLWVHKDIVKGKCQKLSAEPIGMTARLLAKRLHQILKDEPLPVWLLFEGIHLPPSSVKPRCQKNDSTCFPVPYNNMGCYFPTAKRHIKQGGRKHISSRSQIRSDKMTCTHDGECRVGGCGNHCEHYKARRFVATCEGYFLKKPTLCGCVRQKCSWFTQ